MSADVFDPGLINHLEPARERPEVEWSVAMTRGDISTERFVVYGLERATCAAFLQAKDVDAEHIFGSLHETYGPPTHVAVGKDGDRTKLYWFLDGEAPYLVGADFRNGLALPHKRYRLLPHDRLDEIADLLDPRLVSAVGWLLEQAPFQGKGLDRVLLVSRGEAPPYVGVHLGLTPDWLGLMRGDRRLLRHGLVREFLDHLDFGAHWETCKRRLLEPPMAWTSYFIVQIQPTGELAATIYGRSSPVVRLDRSLGLVETGQGGTFPRPVAISFSHAEFVDMSVRMRTVGPERCFLKHNGWKIDYKVKDEASIMPSREDLALVERLSLGAASAGSPHEPADAYDWLCAQAGVESIGIGPDFRRDN